MTSQQSTTTDSAFPAPVQAVRVRIYCDQFDRSGHTPLATAVVQLLWDQHASGVTVVNGVAGFGASRHLRAVQQVDLGSDRPVVIEWIELPERFAAIWPRLRALVAHAVVTRETVDFLVAPHRGMPRLDRSVRVADVMETDFVSVAADAPLDHLTRLMYENELRFVPVLEGDRLVGVITNGDLVRHGVVPLRLQLHRALGSEPENVSAYEVVSDLMTRHVVTIAPQASLVDAAHRMMDHKLKRLPVVDGTRLVGVLSRFDLLRSVASGVAHQEPGPPGVPAHTAGDIARDDVPTVGLGTAITEVLDVVASTRLNCAVVVDDHRRVVGTVSDTALLRRLEGLGESVSSRLMRRLLPHASEDSAMRARTAADVLESPVTTISRDASVTEALRLIVAEQRKILPVVDGDGRLCGIIDRADALRAALVQVGDDDPV
ncbi:MAG: DUF190 domain-containing protein [Candidatus Dormibacteria bacterium]